MTSASKPCKQCGSETRITTLGSFRGEAGPVAVIVNGMPALVCAKDHKRFLYPKFVTRLMELVADPEAVAPQPPAVKRGLFKRRFHCHECDAELIDVTTKKSECGLDVNIKDALPFKVIVQVALHKCDGCGREQVRSNKEIAAGALKAMAHGFHAAGIHADR